MRRGIGRFSPPHRWPSGSSRLRALLLLAALSPLGTAPAGTAPAPAEGAAPASVPVSAAGAASASAPESAAIPVPAEAAAGEVVVAYYCHVTFRCETCLTVERLIEDLLRTDFAEALEKKRLVWQPLDYEQPENEPYATLFELQGRPALVLGRWQAGRLVEWHDELEIWDHSDDPGAVIGIARARISLFMQRERWRAAMDSTRAASATPPTSGGENAESRESR